jgi:hypothetical protein
MDKEKTTVLLKGKILTDYNKLSRTHSVIVTYVLNNREHGVGLHKDVPITKKDEKEVIQKTLDNLMYRKLEYFLNSFSGLKRKIILWLVKKALKHDDVIKQWRY